MRRRSRTTRRSARPSTGAPAIGNHTGACPVGVSIARVPDRLSPDDVAKVARLARLTLSPDETARAAHQLSDMLDHFADIDALDLSDVDPLNQPYPLVNVLRDDEPVPSLDRHEVLAAAPRHTDGRFWVPPVNGGDR